MSLANQFLLIERVAFMGESTVENRVVRLLAGLALYYGHKEGTGYVVDVPITQETIARFTHATRESVSKTLRKLSSQNLLDISKKKLTIANLDALNALLENRSV